LPKKNKGWFIYVLLEVVYAVDVDIDIIAAMAIMHWK